MKIDVAPLAGARIEILSMLMVQHPLSVAPLAGARIEIEHHHIIHIPDMSLPSRERGLKSSSWKILVIPDTVAPLAGARIEIQWSHILLPSHLQSLPSRERGLK